LCVIAAIPSSQFNRVQMATIGWIAVRPVFSISEK
jgi:hypothetical protein